MKCASLKALYEHNINNVIRFKKKLSQNNSSEEKFSCMQKAIKYSYIQGNLREVNTLEVNSRLKSTPDGGPDFFLLCLSNFISLKVNHIGPVLG